MHYAYLGANIISLTIWAGLFWHRPDLRKVMLIMSFSAVPLAFFDLFFVPTYWMPQTLLNIPIGLEGFVYSFSIGGIASVLYSELSKRTPKHMKNWRTATKHARWIPLLTLVIFIAVYILGVPNPAIAAYAAFGTGLIATLCLRPDLTLPAAQGAVAFGIVYSGAFELWAILFPATHSWFTLQYLPNLLVLHIPLAEILFGCFFGAFWGVLYEALFGYKLVATKKANVHK